MGSVIHSRKKGGKNGKARKAATKKLNGFYSRQALRTIANRARKRAKHQRMVEKKRDRKARSFIYPLKTKV